MIIGGHSRLILEDLGKVDGLHGFTVHSDYPRNVVKSEQIMGAPSDDDIRTLVESARCEALMESRRLDLVVNREPSFSFPGLVNDSTCLRVDCCHESWVSHLGVILLSHLLRFHSSLSAICARFQC